VKSGIGEEPAHSAADGAQRQAFRQHLTQNAALRRAQGGAHGNLAAACGGFSQQQIGHIGARDQRYECDGSE
jgi:hypothetical protein